MLFIIPKLMPQLSNKFGVSLDLVVRTPIASADNYRLQCIKYLRNLLPKELSYEEQEMEELLEQLAGKISKSHRMGKRARSSDHHMVLDLSNKK